MTGRKYLGGPRKPFDPDSRYAWVETFIGEGVVYVNDPTERDDREPGEIINLVFQLRYSRQYPIALQLSKLTERELVELKKLIDLAFEWAQPICKLRDQESQKALEVGDDTNPRVYRPIPRLLLRKRPIPRDSEGVPIRPEGLDGLGRSRSEVSFDHDPPGPPRKGGRSLVEPLPEDSSTSDDSPADDGS